MLLTLAGLVAVHVRQREAYSLLGRIGFALAFVGEVAATAVVVRPNEWSYLLAIAFGVVGFFLLSLAIARAPAMPPWSGFLLLVGFVALVAVGDGDFGIALAGAVWLVVGYLLASDRREPAVSPVPGPV